MIRVHIASFGGCFPQESGITIEIFSSRSEAVILAVQMGFPLRFIIVCSPFHMLCKFCLYFVSVFPLGCSDFLNTSLSECSVLLCFARAAQTELLICGFCLG